MKILVTGGGGYVGSVLCRALLDADYNVRCVDNFHKGHCDALIPLCSDDRFEFINGDISNALGVIKFVKDVDAIIHLAAIVGFPDCRQNPGLAKLVNVDGTDLLADAMPADAPFIYASTGSVYGKVTDELCTEQTETKPLSHYGITKLEAEQIILNRRRHSVIYRFATGFGVSPNMRVNLLVNDLVYQCVTNKCVTIFQADFMRTFIHVRDMARAFVHSIDQYWDMAFNKDEPPIYNCGSEDNNWSKRQLAEYIGKVTGATINYQEVGTDSDQRDYAVDYTRLKQSGFDLNIGVAKGIDELIKVSKLIHIQHQYM